MAIDTCGHCKRPINYGDQDTPRCAGCNKYICHRCVRWFTVTYQSRHVVCPICFEQGWIMAPGMSDFITTTSTSEVKKEDRRSCLNCRHLEYDDYYKACNINLRFPTKKKICKSWSAHEIKEQ